MFRIRIRAGAAAQLRRLRRGDAVAILDAIETHLQHEPERTSRSRIKRLRGAQRATYRLRVGEYRVFYDVLDAEVAVVAVLHKRETASFYREDES